jgi:tetratricopeptide (TPR) repeat protein
MTWELGSCLLALGTNACTRDFYAQAVGYLEEAAATARSAGDGLGEVVALSWLGFVQLLLDDLEGAKTSFDASHARASELGSPQYQAYTLSKLGILADAEERYADAMRLHMEANELFARVGDAAGAGYALSRASLSSYGVEDYEEALRLGQAGYEAFSEVNHRWGAIGALCRIGFASLALGDADEAKRTFRAALEQAHASAAISLELLALSGIGALLRETGEQEQAATMLAFALGHEQLPPSYGFAARPALEALEAELPADRLAAARLAAAEAGLEDLVRQALELVPS